VEVSNGKRVFEIKIFDQYKQNEKFVQKLSRRMNMEKELVKVMIIPIVYILPILLP